MDLTAYITHPGTIQVIDLNTDRRAAYLRFDGTDENGLEVLHDAGFHTVGTWNRTAADGSACITVEVA